MIRSVAVVFQISLLAFVGHLVGNEPAAGAGDRVGFNRHIRPILAENCFSCHGPDSAARKADLRLDRREAALQAGALAPGKPDESELIARITAEDPSQVMPPPASHKRLTAAQKQLLRQWIAEGAEYQPLWSFLAPQRPSLPTVKNRAWARTAIDLFILAALEQRGLEPAPEADRRTLARRASLDLTGLPPSPAEVEAFVSDRTDTAYERLLDRLLDSPHWGEHRARYWLDAARYADTNGIHFDNYREAWAYRDWVIDAFQRNLPFDRFTEEQLAGDLLPNPTLEQRIATGFNRCNITTNEGGVIAEEYLVLYTRDRTETTARVWMGLTAGCAVCHDHKFDPLSQKEFYQLSAFFNNTTQGAMDGNAKDTPPVAVVPRPNDRARWPVLVAKMAENNSQKDARRNAAHGQFEAWLAHGQPPALSAIAGETLRADTVARGFQNASAGDFDARQPFSCGAWVGLPAKPTSGAIVARLDDGRGFRGWDLWLENGRVGVHVIHQWPGDALKVVTNAPLKPGARHHLLATYDGSQRAGGVKIYVDGKPQPTRAAADRLKNTIRTEVPLRVGQRHRGSRLEDVSVQDLRIYNRVLAAGEVAELAGTSRARWLLSKPTSQRTAAETRELEDWWLAHLDTPYQALASESATLEREQTAIRARGTVAHVAEERREPPTAYVLFRGDYDKRREQVHPQVPAFLPPMPAGLPKNRLGLARWLLRPEHPLTARVAVNRFWQEVFGTGLVRTSEDFGTSGEPPSHAELLDWLAVEFRESGWDVKRLFRLMLRSAAYRQVAAVTADKLQQDPQNRLLSRGPRFRMDAEVLRDYALAVSGLLVPRIGGPSVKPYQPDGVWEAVAMPESNTRFYRRDTGAGLYRRSMYTFWKRSAPPAAMEIFNAPSREACTVRRERTNTPLHALVTMNDPQFIEAARRLAETALRDGGGTAESRLDFLARRLLARPLRAEEVQSLTSTLDGLLTYYRLHAGAAERLLAVGDSQRDGRLDASAAAAWTVVTNELMNLDEVLNK
jgi:mono/diheme cytochrome c family protein